MMKKEERKEKISHLGIKKCRGNSNKKKGGGWGKLRGDFSSSYQVEMEFKLYLYFETLAQNKE